MWLKHIPYPLIGVGDIFIQKKSNMGRSNILTTYR